MSSYINTIKRKYSKLLPTLENLYNETDYGCSFNEFLIQHHFHYAELNTARKMIEGLPSRYHWIVKRILKHLKMTVNWRVAKQSLTEAMIHNLASESEHQSYQQFYKPLRLSPSVQDCH